MADPRVARLLEDLRRSRFSDLHGARLSASIPVPERLLNQFLASAIPASLPVRDVSVHPKADNRFGVRAKLARADFLPALTLTAEIVRQAELPHSPLVLRISSLPGLISLVGAATSLASVLPPGIRLEGQQLFVDIRALLERAGYGEVVQYLESVRITTEDGKVLVDVAARV
jgi:hypothetical protein